MQPCSHNISAPEGLAQYDCPCDWGNALCNAWLSPTVILDGIAYRLYQDMFEETVGVTLAAQYIDNGSFPEADGQTFELSGFSHVNTYQQSVTYNTWPGAGGLFDPAIPTEGVCEALAVKHTEEEAFAITGMLGSTLVHLLLDPLYPPLSTSSGNFWEWYWDGSQLIPRPCAQGGMLMEVNRETYDYTMPLAIEQGAETYNPDVFIPWGRIEATEPMPGARYRNPCLFALGKQRRIGIRTIITTPPQSTIMPSLAALGLLGMSLLGYIGDHRV